VTTFIDKLAYICIRDRKVLVTRSRNSAGVYYLPGGKREGDETDHEALRREVMEELAVELDVPSIAYMETFTAQAHNKPEGVLVRMTCYTGEMLGEPQPSTEVDDMDWYTYADKQRTSPVDHLIFDWLKEKALID
jgi:8-oxo-dGTP pyrophosphatase MutT (NUDIX family)